MDKRYRPYEDYEFHRVYDEYKKTPLSKKETRLLTLGLLGIKPDDCILDIGGGTGGLTLEAARIAYDGIIFTIDMKSEACKIIRKNAAALGLTNVDIIEGKAPKVLEKLDNNEFNHIIVGGSSGKLKKIVKWSYNHLVNGGSIIGNFMSIENASKFIKLLKKHFKNYEVTILNIAKGKNLDKLTLMKASNPVIIVKADKK